MRYKNEDKVKSNGAVYTPYNLAHYTAKQILTYKNLDNSETLDILDPAAGDGNLLIAMAEEIHLLYPEIKINMIGYDTDLEACKIGESKLSSISEYANAEYRNESFLDAIKNNSIEKFDIVIANPPYIRTQILGTDITQELANTLNLSGRIDIYYAFLVYTHKVLKANGIAGYITSNKFFTIKSGLSVRNFMLNNYRIHHLIDLGDTKLFNAAVLPCVMIFSSGCTNLAMDVKFSSLYESEKEGNIIIDDLLDALKSNGIYKCNGKNYDSTIGHLSTAILDDPWTLATDKDSKWLKLVDNNTYKVFSDIGKIRVGIKTTADNVFISDKWEGANSEIELLKPLITHRNAGQIIPNPEENWQVLYTHEVLPNGKRAAINIENYPHAKKYLNEHREQLEGRSYVIKAKRQWYEIWVPQNPAQWSHKKIVFRDISKEPQFWLDTSGAIVNGDCYWIDLNYDIPDDIIYLALAIANSEFIEKFYDLKFNTKIYAGKRRYMSQYVEQFPIPNPNTLEAKEIINLVSDIIHGNLEYKDIKPKIESLIYILFSNEEPLVNEKKEEIQLELF